jgi:hypothetical protein
VRRGHPIATSRTGVADAWQAEVADIDTGAFPYTTATLLSFHRAIAYALKADDATIDDFEAEVRALFRFYRTSLATFALADNVVLRPEYATGAASGRLAGQ